MKDVFSNATPISFPVFEDKLMAQLPDLPRLEAQVAQYMLLRISDLSFETGASIAGKVGVSEVTVSRLLRRLGYQGMRGLKRELQDEMNKRDAIQSVDSETQMIPDELTRNMDIELKALTEIYHQSSTPTWFRLINEIVEADEIFVTGFQGVRGMAEDCARRLQLTRNKVQFISAHDGMLAEWLDSASDGSSRCLILIDVVPYAHDAKYLSKLCVKHGIALIVFTDEMCHWARNHTELVVYANTRTGLILESTVALGAALNLMVNAVAGRQSATLPARLDQWKSYTRALKLF